MITARYHALTVGAIFLALAVGVLLGSGLLSQSATAPDGDDGDPARDTALVAFEDSYAERTSGGLIDGTLSDRSVVVLTLPGARSSEVQGITSRLEDAGATVTGTTALTTKLLDPTNRQFAVSVAEESGDPDAGVEGYALVGDVLAASVLGEDGAEPGEQAGTIRSAFDEGGLTSGDDRPDRLASAAVIVAGPSQVGETGEVLTGLVRALASSGSAALLAGPSSSSLDGGAVATVRQEDLAVATIDVTDSGAGRAVAALALARALDGETGAWGTSRSADGPLPR